MFKNPDFLSALFKVQAGFILQFIFDITGRDDPDCIHNNLPSFINLQFKGQILQTWMLTHFLPVRLFFPNIGFTTTVHIIIRFSGWLR